MGWTKRGVHRISALTPTQIDQIAVFADKWNRIARCTDPIDEAKAAAGIEQFYKDAGCKTPRCVFSEIDSLVGAWNASWYDYEDVEKINRNFERLGYSDWGIRCRLNKRFEAPVLRQVEQFMHRNVASGMRMGQVSTIEEATEPQQRGRRLGYGQVDAPWLAMADYFATVHESAECEKIRGLMTAVASCGYVWLTPTGAFFNNRPQLITFDDLGRLHCEDGPAISYADWCWYFLHGIATGENFIKTPADQIDIADVLKLKNSDMRRAVLQKIGFERLLNKVKYRVVSRAKGNELIEFKLHIDGHYYVDRFRALRLRWKDKTGAKETVLSVPLYVREFGPDCPDNVNDCEQVRRWTLGWPKEARAVAET